MISPELAIRAWYIPRNVPYGGAPEEIKKGWVDVPLPIRYDRPVEAPDPNIGHDVDSYLDITVIDDSVTITQADSLKALTIFRRERAAEWWRDYFRRTSGNLIFAIAPGDQILPHSQMLMVMPGIEDFERIEI